jgi:proteic killer suppression protein
MANIIGIKRPDVVALIEKAANKITGGDTTDVVAMPRLRLHLLKGERRGQWAVSVSGNWRVVFRFVGEDAVDVDPVDYR